MSDLKTRKTTASVYAFIAGIEDERRRADCKTLLDMMKKATGKAPAIWGSSIVGFDTYTYRYASGRTGDWPVAAFSPRKQSLTIYLMDLASSHKEDLKKLGKYKTAVSCLYIRKLEDVDLRVLQSMLNKSVKALRRRATG
jgi:hypothetical protein